MGTQQNIESKITESNKQSHEDVLEPVLPRSGLHVVMSPGIYHLDEPLTLSHSGQVLLGLGLATLVPTRQNAVVRVGDVDGVRVAGLLLQAGPQAGGAMSPALLEWGTGEHAGASSNPGVISDVFARVSRKQ